MRAFNIIRRINIVTVLLIVLAHSLFVTASQGSDEQQGSLPYQIVNTYGGADRLCRLSNNTFRYQGYFESEGRRESCTEVENGLRYERAFNDGSLRRANGFDGKQAWRTDCGLSWTLSTSEMGQLSCYREHQLFQLLQKLAANCDYKIAGSTEINGCHCTIIDLLPNFAKLFVENKTRLVVRVEYSCRSQITGIGQTKLQVDYSNYRDIDGLKVPLTKTINVDGRLEKYIWKSCQMSQLSDFEAVVPQCKPISIELPFQIDRSNIVLDGKLNKYKVKVCISTGRNVTSISDVLAQSARIKSNDNPAKTETLYSNVEARHALSRLELGKLTLADIPVNIVHTTSQNDSTVYLGSDFLRCYSVSIDFKKGTVLLNSSGNPVLNNKRIELPLKLIGRPYWSAKVNGNKESPFLLDTATPDFVLLRTVRLAELSEGLQPIPRNVHGLDNSRHSALSLYLSKFSIDGLTFSSPKVTLIEPSASGVPSYNVLGMGFLSQFDLVTFDFPHEKLILGGISLPASIDCTRENPFKP